LRVAEAALERGQLGGQLVGAGGGLVAGGLQLRLSLLEGGVAGGERVALGDQVGGELLQARGGAVQLPLALSGERPRLGELRLEPSARGLQIVLSLLEGGVAGGERLALGDQVGGELL